VSCSFLLATNNIAEYEGLVTGLQLAKELGIR
jgi:ribonuclease HI